MPTPLPHAITRRDDGILIEWDGGGPRGALSGARAAAGLPCAACVEEMTGRPLLDPRAIPADIRPVSLALVGAYGLESSGATATARASTPSSGCWPSVPASVAGLGRDRRAVRSAPQAS